MFRVRSPLYPLLSVDTEIPFFTNGHLLALVGLLDSRITDTLERRDCSQRTLNNSHHDVATHCTEITCRRICQLTRLVNDCSQLNIHILSRHLSPKARHITASNMYEICDWISHVFTIHIMPCSQSLLLRSNYSKHMYFGLS